MVMIASNRNPIPHLAETLRFTTAVRRPSSSSTSWNSLPSKPLVGASVVEVESAKTYCVEFLRKYDRPSYTLSTFIPARTQNFYLALRALNVSLSMIPDTTSSYTMGLMRLQFWRDTITRTLLGSPPKEPIAILLGAAVADLDARESNSSLNSKRNWFLRIINAREQSLTNTSFSNLQALESYAENTYSTLLYLTLSALPVNSITADHVASHIGKAAGISTVLRGVPLVAFPPSPSSSGISTTSSMPSPLPKQGTIAIPLDVMAQCGVREEDVFRHGAHAPGLRDAVFTVATRASDHLITARQMIKNLRMGQDVGHSFEHEAEEEHQHNNLQRGHHDQSQSARQNRQEPPSPSSSSSSSAISKQLNEVERSFGVFMPAIVTQLWLNQLQRADFDVFDKALLRSDWRLPWRAYFAYRQREF